VVKAAVSKTAIRRFDSGPGHPGKLAAQAGHAFTDALSECFQLEAGRASAYASLRPGTKIVLRARDLAHLEHLERHSRMLGIPCALITDRNHILPPHFDGRPLITALGIGPLTREEARPITPGLALVP
jgi:peptidyl-tRNA hydrolase